jgi:hypothetical protein
VDEVREFPSAAGPDREALRPGSAPRLHERLRWVSPVAYLSLAMLFMTFYTVRTTWMGPWGIEGLTYAPPFPFRYRILSTFLAATVSRFTGLRLEWAYALQGTLFVWGALLVYQRLLASFMRADLARVLACGLLYVMTWHYCAMNLLYFPFDMPAVFFFVAGWHLLLRQRWPLYYVLFALAVLNRETCLILTMVFALVWFRRLPARALVAHVAAQMVLWLAIKAALYFAFSSAGHQLYMDSLGDNRETLIGILTLQPRGLHNLVKFLLWGGGLWASLPFIFRIQPEPIRRSLLAIGPFVLGMIFVARLREMRIYGEVIPMVVTAALIWVARQLAPGEAPAESASPAAG